MVKNKVAAPFKQAEFQILYGEGTSREGEIIDLGVKEGFVDKAGSWYSYQGNKIGQGKMKVIDYLKEHTEIAQEIENMIRAKLLSPNEEKDQQKETVEG